MLETAVDNGTKKLGLEKEITETSAVNTNVALLHGLLASSGRGIFAIFNGLGSGRDLQIVFLIINKLISRVGHFWLTRKEASVAEQGIDNGVHEESIDEGLIAQRTKGIQPARGISF